MAIGIYMDVHIPSAITEGLKLRGVDVLTAQDDDRRRSTDRDLLTRATELGMALYTHDRDLLIEADRRQKGSIPFLGVIYSLHLYSPIRRCIDDIEIIAKSLEPDKIESIVEYIPF